MKLITALLSLFLLLACEDQSLVLSEKTFTQRCTVSGMVYPEIVERNVDLMTRNGELITSVTVVPGDSMYSFENVEYDSYSITLSAEGFDTLTATFYPERENEWLNTVVLAEQTIDTVVHTLKVVPFVDYFFPSDSLLESENDVTITDDFMRVDFRMNRMIDTTDLRSKLSTSFPVDSVYFYNSSSYENFYLYLFFPWRDVLAEESLAITLNSTISSLDSVPLDTSFTVTYQIDSLLYRKLVLDTQLSSYSPKHGTEHVDITKDLLFYFNAPVNFESVEQAFSLFPAVPASFLWDKSSSQYVLKVSFAEYLPSGTDITVTLDTTFRYEDGSKEEEPIVVKFSTEKLLLNDYSPLNGAKDITTTMLWTFEFSTSMDTAAFRNALTVVPTVDSFDVSYGSSWYSEELTGISIQPYGLTAGTTYTISLDSTVADLSGSTWGRTFTSSFTTKE